MGLPIYQSGVHNDIRESSPNKGLCFDRFFNGYQLKKPDIKPEEKAKRDFLSKFAAEHCGDDKQLENYIARQRKLAEAVDGCYRVYQLDGHFVSGMGNSHPVENGFLWHYTLGTPYFAGSQVKGLVRSLIEQYYQGADKEDILFEWFGSDNKNPLETTHDSKAGNLVFFDAIPFSRPVLSVDVMTPHMGNWYAEGGKIKDVKKDSDKIPADWHDPVPVPFLAVKEANFLFSIGKRPGVDIDIEQVFDLLDKALKYLGAGAKTQTGYGYMSPNEEINKGLN